MEYKIFDKPHSHDIEFYKDREMADHINQPDHKPRLLKVLDKVSAILKDNPDYSVSDLGCGNGGLIELITTQNKWGYDLQPSNVEDAKRKGRNVEFKDFVNESDAKFGDIVIMTETLEHLVDPHGFLKRLHDSGVKHVVASCPNYENLDFHAPFHLWIWSDSSFADMFNAAGWTVTSHELEFFQFVTVQR